MGDTLQNNKIQNCKRFSIDFLLNNISTILKVIYQMNVVLEFSGGAELLVGRVRQHKVNLTPQDDQKPRTLGNLLHWIKENLLQERPELFLKDPAAKELDVRPGILVLVNESDWELCGQTDYELEEGDTITFISTLHGG